MAQSIPHIVTLSGTTPDAREGAIPIELYFDDSPNFNTLRGMVSGAPGADLQEILEGLAARIATLEA